jgi:ATP-dependent Clp protease ATP-binding subunit ClpC
MKLTIPLYVRSYKGLYRIRPLFFHGPTQEHEKLERAMHRLAHDLRKDLHLLGERLRHDALAAYGFNPPLQYKRIDLALDLRKRTARCRYFLVTFEALGRRLAFTPNVPDLWFELGRGETLPARATEVFTAYFREREKEEEEQETPEKFAMLGTAWIGSLELDIHPSHRLVDEEQRRASLGSMEQVSGYQELFRVGRCLDQLYPDDLDRVLLRDREVEELTGLLRAPEKRPVLLLGPAQVGKTALLHEYVWRVVAGRKDPYRIHNNVWLLSPQRLISGMSYVGQWENRLLAIVKEAKERDHILYFNDLLGLYYAGKSAQSDLSVAHVLKPYIERREVRMVGEMTPESFRVLRERDRGFADLFHLLPLDEPRDAESLRILIAVSRQLEGQHRCCFALDVLPTVIDLERRYVRHLSFPGKAAGFLRRLAVKQRGQDISRQSALEEFHAQSGLVLSFLDTRSKLSREEVIKALSGQVIGQSPALEAAADVIAVAKARLNEPDRPLASFLFLGPTGVGKTQCAKAVAEYLFGDADKVLRFDMNEYLHPGAAAQLVGTFDQPEGLLTAAVRRQPFAVVLLDEIEKAHPEVFDLLLQVLGEGRLTDALGRTVDFSNAIVLLTSNLGVREAQKSLGFTAERKHDPHAYSQAAERFFRPEFFNRLDRIVPFAELSRAEVGRIARLLIRAVFRREGLIHRRCILRVDDQALERVVDQGFDPVLGARALKRALERQLVRPVGARLAAGLPEGFTVVSVLPRGAEISVRVESLEQAEPVANPAPDLDRLDDFLDQAKRLLRRLEDHLAPYRPRGEISGADVQGDQGMAFLLQQDLRRLRLLVRDLEERWEDNRLAEVGVPSLPVQRNLRSLHPAFNGGPKKRNFLREMAAAQDIQLYLQELSEQGSPVKMGENWVRHLLEQLKVLNLVVSSLGRRAEERALVLVWTAGGSESKRVEELVRIYERARFTELSTDDEGGPPGWRLEVTRFSGEFSLIGQALLVEGVAAVPIARVEEGTHLFCPEGEPLEAVQVHVWPLREGDQPAEVLERQLSARRAWLEQLSRSQPSDLAEPLALAPVLRIYGDRGHSLDLRNEQTFRFEHLALGNLIQAVLPMPEELGS